MIVGMGNPGAEYAQTRHNIGWMVCEALCEKFGGRIEAGKGNWYQTGIKIHSAEVLVLFPTTYMNNSGEAVAHAQRLFHVPPEQTLIIVDEYNFPLGKIHLKGQGSDGGHNGTASVIQHLGTEHFWRLRCGIARNFGPGELVRYVLSPFSSDEEEGKKNMIERSVEAVRTIMKAGPQRVMPLINTERAASEQ